MTVAEQVANMIPSGDGALGYCDDCITEGLELSRRQQVQPITSALAMTNAYVRWQGECAICHRIKLVITKV